MPSQKTNKQSASSRTSPSSRAASAATEPVQIIHSNRIAQSGSASYPPSAGAFAPPYRVDPSAVGSPFAMDPAVAFQQAASPTNASAGTPAALGTNLQAIQAAQAFATTQAATAAQSAQATQSLLALQAAQATQAASAAQSAQIAQGMQAMQATQAALSAQTAQNVSAGQTAPWGTSAGPAATNAFASPTAVPSASEWANDPAVAGAQAGADAPFVTPPAYVSDEGSAYTCSIDLPGVSGPDINLTCANNTLYVHAVRRAEPGVTSIIQAEQSPSRIYRRAIALPSEINTSQAEAKLASGTLTVRLPKEHPTEAPSLINVQE